MTLCVPRAGVREMCDVCDTTLFNMHWCCAKCGFVVCIDCYRHKTKKVGGNQDKHIQEDVVHLHSKAKWINCSATRQAHEAEKLCITQIIPSDGQSPHTSFQVTVTPHTHHSK